MKQLLYILCIATLLASCRKTEPNGETLSEQELTFNLSIDGMPTVETRAAGDDSDLKTHGFYLAGYHTEGLMNDASASASPNVFNYDAADGQEAVPLVSFANNKFTLKTIKWKLDNTSYLSFYGWSQNKQMGTTSTTGIIGQTTDANDKGYPWIDICNADAPSDQTDIVGSRSENHKNDAVISAVDLDFGHLLSKLSFKAKSTTKASVTFTAVTVKYTPSKVFKKARYTFGSDAATIGNYGAYAEYQSGDVALNSTYPAISNGAEVSLGSLLLIPQSLAAGDLSLEIKYKTIASGGSTTIPEQTRTLPLSAFAFEQGKNYLYTLDIRSNEIVMTTEPSIELWQVVGNTELPLIAGPKGNTILLLDGYDKPFPHNGKLYWLDRSGYNRHMELAGGYVSYDSIKHGYVFKRSAVGGTIPNFRPTSSSVYFDMVAEGTGTAVPQNLFELGYCGFQLPSSGNTVRFRGSGNPGSITWTAPSRSDINKQTFWSGTYGANDEDKLQIYHNASLKNKYWNTTFSLNFEDNKIAPQYDGRISFLKVSQGARPTEEFIADFFDCKKRFNIEEKPSALLPPVTDGLLFCLDGRSGKEDIDGLNLWRDQVGKNDAKVVGTVNWSSNRFQITSSSDPANLANRTNYLNMFYKVAMTNDFTVEMVLRPNGTYSGSPVYWADGLTRDMNKRILSLHIPYAGPKVYIDAPGQNRYDFSWPSDVGGATEARQVAIRRKYGDKSEFFIRGVVKGTGSASEDISKRKCEMMDIGGFLWSGDFYLLRVYNRALTDEEMQKNYQYNINNLGYK